MPGTTDDSTFECRFEPVDIAGAMGRLYMPLAERTAFMGAEVSKRVKLSLDSEYADRDIAYLYDEFASFGNFFSGADSRFVSGKCLRAYGFRLSDVKGMIDRLILSAETGLDVVIETRSLSAFFCTHS